MTRLADGDPRPAEGSGVSPRSEPGCFHSLAEAIGWATLTVGALYLTVHFLLFAYQAWRGAR